MFKRKKKKTGVQTHGYEIKVKPYEEDHVAFGLEFFKTPITTIYIGENPGVQIEVDKKFNWFQKKMIKWCFGFEVKENA